LFKSWFVDFDPVRAKMEGKQPFGMDTATAALFPSRLIPSSLGDIPEGWAVDEIGNVVTAVGGSTPSTEKPEYWAGGHHAWATPKDLSNLKSPVLLTTERQITDAGISVISSGLLPAGTVLMSSRAPIGYIAIPEVPVAVNQGFIAMVCNKKLPNLYVWLWTHNNLDTIKNHSNGSTFQEISKGSFRPLPCIVPTDPVLQKFQEIISPVWQKIVSNTKETVSLEKQRDYLLPKLISGDIRIPDAEKFMEAA
jgi:type I restriction enzyme S subunit